MTAPRHHLPTFILVAVGVYASAIVLHEAAHGLAGSLAGGDPTLLTSTDLRGEWSDVSRWGLVALGTSGSLANLLVALTGAVLLGSGGLRSAAARWCAWLVAAVNGLVPAVYMVASPLLDFGDWATVLRRFELHVPLRVAVATTGLVLSVLWVRWCAGLLAPLLTASESGRRGREALYLTRGAWLSGGAIAVAAALWSPLGLTWALPIAAGSTLGTTWPMMVAARLAAERRAAGDLDVSAIGPARGWMAGGAILGLVFVVVVGRGIPL